MIPTDLEVKDKILREVHQTPYTAHPKSTKMYKDLEQHFLWEGMKKDVTD